MTPAEKPAVFASRVTLPALAAFAVALLAVLWVCHREAFDAPFYGDTVYHLQQRTNLHLSTLSWRALWDAAHLDFGGPLYRPLSNWSLALTHYVWGLRPAPYRVGNLLVHWAASLAAVFLFLSVLRSPRVRERSTISEGGLLAAALVGAALWSLHPVQTNVTTYVIQRMASLSGLFTFLCVGAHLRGRSCAAGWSWPWAGGSLLALALALASKESSVTAFPLLLLSEVVLLVPPVAARPRRILLAVALTLLGLVATALLWRGPALWAEVAHSYRSLPFTMGQRLLTEARLQFQYLLVLLVPDPRLLTFDAQVAASTGLFSPPTTAAAVACLAAAAGLAVRNARERPLLCFGVLWFLVAQLVESTVLPLEFYFEHRMYAASAFLYLGAGVLAARGFAARRRLTRVGAAVAVVMALAAEGWATTRRNALWVHPVLFWTDAVAKAPGKARTHLHLAKALSSHGFYPEAEKELAEADRLGGVGGYVAFNRGTVAYQLGRPAAAEKAFWDALGHDDVPAWLVHRRLADLTLEQGRVEEAVHHLEAGLREKPDDAGLWELLGRANRARGDERKARECFLRSLFFDPTNEQAREGLAQLPPPAAASQEGRETPTGRSALTDRGRDGVK